METNSLNRARQFLRFSPTARTLTWILGPLASLLVLFDLFFVWLIADLLIVRGELPRFAQLSADRQTEWVNQYRKNAQSETETFQLPKILPPWPIEKEAELQEWAKVTNRYGDITEQAFAEWNLRYINNLKNRLIDLGFTEKAQNLFQPNGTIRFASLQDGGLISLVLRLENQKAGWLVKKFAHLCGWTWRASEDSTANDRCLRGLLLLLSTTLLLQFACLGGTYIAASRVCLEAMVRLRRSIYHQALRLAEYRADDRKANEVARLAMDEVEEVHESFYLQVTSKVYMPILFAVLILGIVLIEPRTSLLMLLLCFLAWLMAGQLLSGVQSRVRRSTRMQSGQSVLLQESFGMIRLVKSYLMEAFNLARVERQLSDYSHWQDRRTQLEAIVWPMLCILTGFWGVVILYFSGRWVFSGDVPLASILVQFFAVILLVLPIRSHFRTRSKLKKGEESAEQLFAYLDRKSEIGQYVDADFLQPITKKIEFQTVSAKAGERRSTALKNISLTIPAYSRVALVGLNEAEKQLLIALLPRFQDPTEGEIRLDGRNIRYYTHDSLRAQIGMVLQSDMIFNDTVASNIGCGDPSFNLPQIIEAAKLTHAHQFIQKLPYGYMTMIGGLGHNLTPGEEFRLGLARAILRDPSILIIEEPQEQWDEDTKTLVDDTIDRIAEGRTLLFLAHRISTLKKCDQVILLERGTIVATGTHKDLLQQQERYRHLYYVEFSDV